MRLLLQPQTLDAGDWQRWNDYGIGLLLQGDLKAAESAFENVTRAVPTNPDGYVNLGRAAVQEGDMEKARAVLTKALVSALNWRALISSMPRCCETRAATTMPPITCVRC